MMSVVQLKALLHVLSAKLDGQDTDFIQYYLDKIIIIIEEQKSTEPASELFNLAIKCLINLSSDSNLSEMIWNIFKTENDRIKFVRSTSNFMTPNSKLREHQRQLIIDLISNLTRDPSWSSLYFEVNENHLTDMIFNSSNDLQDFLPILLNLTAQHSIQKYICSSGNIKEIVTILSKSPVTSDKILAAGIIKNCSFNDECHVTLLSDDLHLLDALLMPFCGPEDCIDSEDRSILPKSVEAVTGNASVKRQFCKEIILTNCQTLFQFCSTKSGRVLLRSNGVYFVLRELHKFVNKQLDQTTDEEDKISLRDLIFHIELVVDQLICEEKDREERYRDKNLREIEVDSTVADELEKAKQDFMACS